MILKTNELSSTPALKVVFVPEGLVAYFLWSVSLHVQGFGPFVSECR